MVILKKKRSLIFLNFEVIQVVFIFLICISSAIIILCFGRPKSIFDDSSDSNFNQMEKNSGFSHQQVWMMYYNSFANIETDGHWGSWRYKNHPYELRFHEPPKEFPSCYFPKNGIYSSHDEKIITSHLQLIDSMKIDAIVVPWFGKNRTDIEHNNNITGFTATSMQLLFKNIKKYNVKIIPMIPNYEGRTLETVIKDIEEFDSLYYYSQNDSLYKYPDSNQSVIFIYDSQNLKKNYKMIKSDLNPKLYFGSGLSYDDFMCAFDDGFYGFITFFASNSISFCSSTKNWKSLSKISKKRNFEFIPTVSPGYNISAIDLWSSKQTCPRNCSEYYRSKWNEALNVKPNIIFINSFNGWREATNIEPAIEKGGFLFGGNDWCKNDSDYYIKETLSWVKRYKMNES
ncbi:glycoprotein endo-alpha-1,2-mannosidase [Tritrichomonas foetus]|uniref:Glycoprotein endo-alpha-1,2-mannosidase n=1 Tax=Tritrichomonas foetus TaxID=1144522 RepID=A0A1J4JB59_9EUKA|nr:glycoprotein endo-alpha-1,2-mannosidase [Tritrichomonas foetus]|eukprot:OHS95905.1 glycoprotein endo-alpha-1,2-mannosidase [Tritrichomonas foetus]